ncbi:MAG TPA: peptidylprolyl isomerase [bacterium]|nr:peptidylprolyl isomerase [bacterium]
MTSRSKVIIFTAVFVVLATAAAVTLTAGMKRSTAVAARVNGEVIYATDLDTEVDAIARQYGIPDDDKQRTEIIRIVLDQMIEQRIINQEARRYDAVASEAQISTQLADIRRNFPSDAEFRQALEQRRWTLADLKNRLRGTITMQNLTERVTTITVTDAEIQKYFNEHRSEYDQAEQVRVSHILLETEAEARLVLARLRRGEKFGELAQQYSKDPGSKAQGGDLGFVSRGQLVGEFEKAAFSLKPGQTSGIVKTQFGFHIIRVTDSRSPQAARIEAVRDQIRGQLLTRKREAAFQEWLKQAKGKAKITRVEKAKK